jgi:hypothetical protein
MNRITENVYGRTLYNELQRVQEEQEIFTSHNIIVLQSEPEPSPFKIKFFPRNELIKGNVSWGGR